MIIRIQDLRLRAIIGIYDWERTEKQDVVINIELEFDGTKASQSDQIDDTVDYKTLTKRIIQHVEDSQFFLVEKLADSILNIVMDAPLVQRASVIVDKPQALRFADSVSIECTASRDI